MRYFPALHFNQMVLKALFNNIALQRIVGLTARLNPELARMAMGWWAYFRIASGLTVPFLPPRSAGVSCVMIHRQMLK